MPCLPVGGEQECGSPLFSALSQNESARKAQLRARRAPEADDDDDDDAAPTLSCYFNLICISQQKRWPNANASRVVETQTTASSWRQG